VSDDSKTVVGVDHAAEGGDRTVASIGGPDAVRVAGVVFDGVNDPFPVFRKPTSLPSGWTFLPAEKVHCGAVDTNTGAQDVTVDVVFPGQMDRIFIGIKLDEPGVL
jgi:hypothetical protein